MGRRHEQAFLQRRHPDSQQTREKMLNITHHQRNANQNYNEMSPSACQKWLKSKTQEATSIGEEVEKKEPLCTVGGNANWCRYCGKQYGGSLKS